MRRSRRLASRASAALAVLLAGVLGSAVVPAATAATDAPAMPADVALPPVGGGFDYQLGGAYPPPKGVTVVTRDRTATPAHAAYGICYVNAFQTQPGELGWWQREHPGLLLRVGGRYVFDPDWPGEVLLDTSTAQNREELTAVVGEWIDGCAAKGFDAVELDNLDSWARSRGLLNSAANLAFATTLTARAHARSLAVAQKNSAELADIGPSVGFDFAVAEECQVYAECDAYLEAYGSHVLDVEYTDNGLGAFAEACQERGQQISLVLRDRDLVARGKPGYVYSAC